MVWLVSVGKKLRRKFAALFLAWHLRIMTRAEVKNECEDKTSCRMIRELDG